MVRLVVLSLAIVPFVAGCGPQAEVVSGDAAGSGAAAVAVADDAVVADAADADPNAVVPEVNAAEAEPSEAGESASPSDAGESVSPSDANAQAAKVIALTPENTKIQFVGTHTGDDPKPRKGSFGEFAGKMTLAGDAVESIEVEIQTASLSTEIDKLTGHLKSPDFFDIRQYPTARFVSTSIKPGEGDQVTIVGDLTLRGQTASITFPATVKQGQGVQLQSEFTIDRTQFGMDYGLEGVEKPVAMTVSVDAR